jgi:D-arabinose 1-dehydrogenase-like Zn-dependent alcohol dehydrogenase
MQAVRFVGTGRPPELGELPVPTVDRPDDVLVRVAGAGVCRTDLHILDGQAPLRPPPPPPFTLGHENAGWVEAVGSGVEGLRLGTPVILHPGISCGLCGACRAGQDMYCPRIRFPGVDGTDGGYAEYVRSSVRAVVPLAPGTDPGPLAPYADAGITAYHAIRRILPRLGPNSVVVVLGVGGLGQFGVQLFKAMTSAEVVALDRNPDRIDFARSLGADHAFSSEEDSAIRAVRDLTSGAGADVVMDFVAEGDAPKLAVSLLRRGGTYSIVGYGGQVSVPTMGMITQEYELLGNFVGTFQDLTELMALQQRGKIRVATQRYPLGEAANAIGELRAGKVRGRAILVP